MKTRKMYVFELTGNGMARELFDKKWQAEAEAKKRAYAAVERDRRFHEYHSELAKYTVTRKLAGERLVEG